MYKIGDIVRTTIKDYWFDDFSVGDTGKVTRVNGTEKFVKVDWITRNPGPASNGDPVTLLFFREIEKVEE